MNRNHRPDDDSLVNIESRNEDTKTQHDNLSISDDFLQKFYSHCANIIKDAWKSHIYRKKPIPTQTKASTAHHPIICQSTKNTNLQSGKLLLNKTPPKANSNTNMPPTNYDDVPINKPKPKIKYDDELIAKAVKSNYEDMEIPIKPKNNFDDMPIPKTKASQAKSNGYEPTVPKIESNKKLNDDPSKFKASQKIMEDEPSMSIGKSYTNYEDIPIQTLKKQTKNKYDDMPIKQTKQVSQPQYNAYEEEKTEEHIKAKPVAIVKHHNVKQGTKANKSKEEIPIAQIKYSSIEDDRPLPTLNNNAQPKEANKGVEEYKEIDSNKEDEEATEINSKPKKPFLKKSRKYDPKQAIMYVD